jgi:hypothetical protein
MREAGIAASLIPRGSEPLALALEVSCLEMIYVGNERKDVDGGKAAGCRTVLVWRAGGDVPAWGQASTCARSTPRPSISSLRCRREGPMLIALCSRT